MITLGPIQSLAASADTANAINCFLDVDVISAASPPDAFGGRGPFSLGTGATPLAAAAAGQQMLVKSISLSNISAADVVVVFFSNGTAAANRRYTLTVPAAGSAGYEDGRGWVVYDRNGLAMTSLVPFDVPLPVNQGGSGATTLPAHGIVLGQGTLPLVATAALGDGQLLVGQSGADPLPRTLAGIAALGADGTLAFSPIAADAFYANSGGASAAPAVTAFSAIALSQWGAAAADLDLGGFRLGNVAAASAGTDAPNLAQVAGLIAAGYSGTAPIGVSGGVISLAGTIAQNEDFTGGVGVNLASGAQLGALSVAAAGAAGTALSIQGLAAQTGPYFRTYDSGGNVVQTFLPISGSDPRAKLNVYNTLEAAPTNYERLSYYFDNPNNLGRIETQNGGSGSLRALALQAGGGRTLVGATTDDGATTLQVTGNASVSKTLNFTTGATVTTGNIGAFPAGVSFGNVIRAQGALDAGGTTNTVGILGELQVDGATPTAASLIAFRGNAIVNGSAGSLNSITAFGGYVRLANAMSISQIVLFSAVPQFGSGSSGNIASMTYYAASTGSYSGTGDMTGTVQGFTAGNIGRATAGAVTCYVANDQTKGSGNAIAYRGLVAAAAGKYNLYLDGTAQNRIAGNVAIGVNADPTSKLLLGAGTATANTAPLQFSAGTSETTARAGVVEYDGNQWYATPSSAVRMTAQLSKAVGAAITAATYTQLQSDTELLFNSAAGCTLTLLAASSYPGRKLWVQNLSGFALASAAANVIPAGGASAGSAILPATAGAWAVLQSSGSNWQVLASSSAGATGQAVLAYVEVNSTSATVSYSTSSTSAVAVDATNLKVTFTAPASGKVKVTLAGSCGVTTNSLFVVWCLLNNSGTPLSGAPGVGNSMSYQAGWSGRLSSVFYVTGLTPGTAYTYQWGWYVWSGAACTGTLQGGIDASGRGPIGAISMMVEG